MEDVVGKVSVRLGMGLLYASSMEDDGSDLGCDGEKSEKVNIQRQLTGLLDSTSRTVK